MALVSDAGTPLVSDPGAALVADAVAAGHRVVPIPGASSLVTALSASGLPDRRRSFSSASCPPSRRREGHGSKVCRAPTRPSSCSSRRTASQRCSPTLLEVFGATRRAAVCRELTKIHETFDRGTLAELAARYADREVKGEIVLVVGPPEAAAPPADEDVDAALRDALKTTSVKEAAQAVAAATGLSRRDLYQRALALKGRG